MKRIWRLGAVCLCLGAPVWAQDAADRILADIARSDSLDRNLRTICDEIGPRMIGTPAMDRAVDWAVAALREAGVDEAHSEKFEVPLGWYEGRTEIEVLGPSGFPVQGVSTAWSPPTRGKGVEAEIVSAGDGSTGSVRRLGPEAAGKILLIQLDEVTTFFGLGVAQRDAIYAIREAKEVGAAAVVFASTRPNRLLYRHIHTVSAELDPVPSAVLAREDALRIARLLRDGKSLHMRLRLENHTRSKIPAANVVGEIRGAEKPEEIVLLGAHLDSWDLGTGCLDNGVNSALVIEAARAIAASGSRPKRTIRFVLFGAEEVGLLGSQAYVRSHRDELDRFTAVVVHDMGLGEIEGYSYGGRRELEEPLREAMQPLGARANRHKEEAFFGSDHFDFMLEGVPALVAIQDTSDYVPSYHSEADTYDKVSISELRRRTQTAAITLFGLANLEERFGKRLNREEVDRLLDTTGVDEQLRFLNLWDDWESGKRGRQP